MERDVSRRDFLRDAAVAAALTQLPPASRADDAGPPPAPGPVNLSLTLNDARMSTRVEPRVSLLDALRDYLGLTSAGRGCNSLDCGACTVLLDGRPVHACSVLALEADGKSIQTADTLKDGGLLDPVPAALVAHDAMRCGHCAPGLALTLRTLLDNNPKTTPAEIEKGLVGHVCSCGTAEPARRAVAALAQAARKE